MSDSRPQRSTVLLVDDDLTFCRVLARTLEKRGFDVYTATELASGLELAGDHQPDYAVIDLRIGQESGLEVVQQLHSRHPALRILMLTGYASIATAVEAIKLGAVHYLTKPASVDDILQALQREQGDVAVSPAEQPVSIKRLEWEHLQKVLLEHEGNISAAARALNMHRRTLQRKLAKRPVRD
ncbi:MAG: response regulator transcription factor [Gammaproteobacteria bacterium]|nr:response regulator transcription factor [Gammaproteobacteria bacterium]